MNNKSRKAALKTASYHPDEHVEICSFTKDVQNCLLTYSDGSTLSESDLLSPSLAVPHANLETISGTTAISDPVTIYQNPDFETQRLNIQVKKVACCQKFSDHKVIKPKSYCDEHCNLDLLQ